METDYASSITPPYKVNRPRIPVEVTLNCNREGKLIPLFVKWKTGCFYRVDQVLDIKPRGLHSAIYKVKINGKITFLYYNDRKWFVDNKK